MTIDPRLYQKVTGRMPGEAMDNLAKTYAKQRPRDAGDTSTFGAVMRGRAIMRLMIAIAALVLVAGALLAGKYL